MTMNKALFTAACFFSILFAVFMIEGGIMLINKDFANAVAPQEEAIGIVERLRLSTSVWELIQSSLCRYRDHVNQNRMAFASKELSDEQLKPPTHITECLPEHSFSVVLAENGKYIRHADFGKKQDKEFFVKFLETLALSQSSAKEIYITREFKARIAEADAAFQRYLKLPVARISFTSLRSGILTAYNGDKRSVGMFWDYVPITTTRTPRTIYYFCKLNLDTLNRNTPEFILRNAARDGIAAAFYNIKNNTLKVNHLYKTLRSEEAIQNFERLCMNKVRNTDYNFSNTDNLEAKKYGSFICALGRPLFEQQNIPIVVLKLPETKIWIYSGLETTLGLACAFFFLALFIQTAVFKRGIRLTVRRVLIICTFTAMLIPILAGHTISKLIIEDRAATEQMKLERSIHSTLNSIDNSFNLCCANLIQCYKNVMHRLDIQDDLKELTNLFLVHKKQNSDSETLNEQKSRDIVFNIQRKVNSLIFGEKEKTSDTAAERNLNSISICGPNNFLCSYNHLSKEITQANKKREESIGYILRMFIGIMQLYYPKETVSEALRNPNVDLKLRSASLDSQAVVGDMAKEELQKTLGKKELFQLTSQHDKVRIIKASSGKNYVFTFPVYVKGMIEYFCAILWDETMIVSQYLLQVFSDLKVRNDTENNKTFSLTSRPPLQIMAYGGVMKEELRSSAADAGDLPFYLRTSERSGQMTKVISKTEKDNAIYQVVPGRSISLYTIGARQDLTYLNTRMQRQKILFYIVIALFLLFALISAMRIGKAFSEPLEHVLWGLKMIESNNYNVKLKDSREDEFGSIARAFNHMVKSLRERNLLDKFVSNSVKKLAADPKLFQSAMEGSEEQYTIIFLAFNGLLDLISKSRPEDIQAKLESGLNTVFRYTEEAGGEIDKVIGEKILIVFPNKKMGRKDTAKAAIELVKKLKAAFADDSEMVPVFGINSGSVISGIIGAQEVRLDNTIIGDPVNVASRLCSLASPKDRSVVISGNIKESLDGEYECLSVENQKIRGKRQEVDVFSLSI